MCKWRMIPVVLAALVVAATVRADLMPASPPPGVPSASLWTGVHPGDSVGPVSSDTSPCAPPASRVSLPTPGLVTLFDRSAVAGEFGSLPAGSLPQRGSEGGPAGETPPVTVLSDSQGSLTLCLYGLLGFGAFRSLSCVKKLSFGFVPDWYHSDAPSQIGHSYAIAPDCLCAAPVYCFIQPDGTARDCQPQYLGGMITSLWRQSQFTPLALTSRGPPSLA